MSQDGRREATARHERRMHLRATAARYGFYAFSALFATGVMGSCYKVCAWDNARDRRLSDAVNGDLTAQGFDVDHVESIRLISPPLKPEAVVKVGGCLVWLTADEQEGQWQIDPDGFTLSNRIDNLSSPVTRAMVDQAFPECFDRKSNNILVIQ